MKSVNPEEINFDRLIDPIIADFEPVTPLWPVTTRLSLWLLLQFGILGLFVAAGTHAHSPLFRAMPNLAWKLENWQFLAGVAGLAVVGIMAASSAFKTAIPGEGEISAGKLIMLLVLACSAFALMVHEPAHPLASMHQFVTTGTRCAICVVMIAAIPWLGLFWASRRAMPLMGATEGGLIGIATFAFSFAATRMGCPIDDFAHVVIWHALPAAIGAGLSVVAGVIWLRGFTPNRDPN
ncbi:MAG TPA: NrsF family protein [Candidatus Binataceae bacterium]|nr:NrsF family protein [Candidatus Binataceae bacterium]